MHPDGLVKIDLLRLPGILNELFSENQMMAEGVIRWICRKGTTHEQV